ncbi:MAG: hypothetical protein ABI534_08280 [Chloroflexota bacterium]
MKVTTTGLIRATSIAAMLAGALFVIVQIVHPPETVEAVASDAWGIVHYLSLVMLTLFVVGVTGIYARQVEKLGWIGLVGFVALSFGLLLNIGGGFIEALVEPLLATSNPDFVDAFNAMVMGSPYNFDLGALPLMWSAASLPFIGGTLLFGIANLRAGVLSRWASGVFAFGLAIGLPIATLIGNQRLAAVPISIGLAWLGYSLWSESRTNPAPLRAAGARTADAATAA